MTSSNFASNTNQRAPFKSPDPSPLSINRKTDQSFPQLVRQSFEQHLESHENISVLALDGNQVFVILETKHARPETLAVLNRVLTQDFHGYSLTIRTIEYSDLSSPNERALYRKLYLAHPQVSRIDTVNSALLINANINHCHTNEQLINDVRNHTGRHFTISPCTVANAPDTNHDLLPSTTEQYGELQRIADAIWNQHSFNQPFNSLSIDFGKSKIELNSEYNDGISSTCDRLLKRWERELHPYSLCVSHEFPLRELGAFLNDILPPNTLGYKVAQEGSKLLVNIIVEAEIGRQSDEINAYLTNELRKHYRHEVVVSVTRSTRELAEELFFDTEKSDFSLDEAQIRQQIYALMPTRHDLRKIRFYPERALTELTVTSPPPAKIIHRIESLTGGAVAIKTMKLPAPTEMVKNPVQWIKKYGEPLPYFEAKNEDTMTLLGHGGFLSVGGSCMLLNFFGRKILLDVGGYLNTNKRTKLPKETVHAAEFVVISHAHFDHTGDLLDAVLQGLSVPILTTHSTAIAMYAVLEEQARIKGLPPKVVQDVYKKVRIVPFYEPLRLANNLTVTFYPAGHLVGAALTRFEFEKDNGEVISLLYTGDFKYGESRLHEKATLPPPSNIVIAEGTYGTKEAPERTIVEKEFFAQIQETVKRRGTTLLPVLSLNRAQEVLSILDDTRGWFSRHRVPIHIVGSIIEKNQIYSYLSEANPNDFKPSVLVNKPWRFNHHTPVSKPKKGWFDPTLLNPSSPKVIVASGGMLIGQAEKLLKFFSESEKNLLLLTCYQAEGTLGREILDYAEGCGPKPKGYKKFRMRVSRSQLSGHSSGAETVAFLSKVVKPTGTVVLVHGEKNSLTELEATLRARGISQNIVIPKLRLTYDLAAAPSEQYGLPEQ